MHIKDLDEKLEMEKKLEKAFKLFENILNEEKLLSIGKHVEIVDRMIDIRSVIKIIKRNENEN